MKFYDFVTMLILLWEVNCQQKIIKDDFGKIIIVGFSLLIILIEIIVYIKTIKYKKLVNFTVFKSQVQNSQQKFQHFNNDVDIAMGQSKITQVIEEQSQKSKKKRKRKADRLSQRQNQLQTQ